MKFGIFYELQLPRPWADDGEYNLINNALDQLELADGLGYDFACTVTLLMTIGRCCACRVRSSVLLDVQQFVSGWLKPRSIL